MSLRLGQLPDLYAQTNDLREATLTTYRASVRALQRFLGHDPEVDSVTYETVLQWRRFEVDKGLSKRSWNTYSSHLCTLFRHLIQQKRLEDNPFKKTRLRVAQRKKKTVTDEAIEAARRWLEQQVEHERFHGRAPVTPAWFWLAVFETFVHTGIRLNALLCLRLADVDLQKRTLLIRGDTEKTHREFMVPATATLYTHLQQLVNRAVAAGFQTEDQLFNVNRFSPHYKRRTMNLNQVEAIFTKISEKIGTKLTPHRCRHTLATELMRRPERDIHLAMKVLNHSNVSTTMGYIEPDQEQMRALLEGCSQARDRRPPKRVVQNIDPTVQEPKRAPVEKVGVDHGRAESPAASPETQPPRTAAEPLPSAWPSILEQLNQAIARIPQLIADQVEQHLEQHLERHLAKLWQSPQDEMATRPEGQARTAIEATEPPVESAPPAQSERTDKAPEREGEPAPTTLIPAPDPDDIERLRPWAAGAVPSRYEPPCGPQPSRLEADLERGAALRQPLPALQLARLVRAVRRETSQPHSASRRSQAGLFRLEAQPPSR